MPAMTSPRSHATRYSANQRAGGTRHIALNGLVAGSFMRVHGFRRGRVSQRTLSPFYLVRKPLPATASARRMRPSDLRDRTDDIGIAELKRPCLVTPLLPGLT